MCLIDGSMDLIISLMNSGAPQNFSTKDAQKALGVTGSSVWTKYAIIVTEALISDIPSRYRYAPCPAAEKGIRNSVPPCIHFIIDAIDFFFISSPSVRRDYAYLPCVCRWFNVRPIFYWNLLFAAPAGTVFVPACAIFSR